MENPQTWGQAEKIVHKAFQEWWSDYALHVIGLSLARRVTDALRAEGLLKEDQ